MRWKALPATLAVLSLTLGYSPASRAQERWEKPSPAVDKVLTAPLPPREMLSPDRAWMIKAQPRRYPPVAELARPMLRLAGERINRRNRGKHQTSSMSDFRLVRLSDLKEVALPGLPGPASQLSWSADGKKFAAVVETEDSIEVYVGDVAAQKFRHLPGVVLNGFFQNNATWLSDSRTLLVQLATPLDEKELSRLEAEPTGPSVIDASGGKATSTYEVRDVLKSPKDEAFFDAYATSQPALVDTVTGKLVKIGKPGIYPAFWPSPDGNHFLVESIHRPYSYLTTHGRFPREVEIWSRDGGLERKLTSRPLADKLTSWQVELGPRLFRWQTASPATLCWAEAVDGGDIRVEASQRDKVLRLAAPFTGEPETMFILTERYNGLAWIENDERVIVSSSNPLSQRSGSRSGTARAGRLHVCCGSAAFWTDSPTPGISWVATAPTEPTPSSMRGTPFT